MQSLTRRALVGFSAAAVVLLFGCGQPSEPTPTCFLSLSPAGLTFSSDGGTATIAVTATPDSCTWTTTTATSWISILEGASGAGPGIVKYAVAPNSSPEARTGALSIGGVNYSVGQQGLTPGHCSYAISPSDAAILREGGSGSVAVTTAPSCPWTAVSTASWLAITAGSQGLGSGSVSYTAARNDLDPPRTAALAIADQTFLLTQAGQVLCTYAISPAGRSIGSEGDSGTIDVTAPASCPWTATSDAAWLRVTSGATGSGAGSVTYAVDANTAAAERSARIAIGDRMFVVTQTLSASSCEYSVAPVLVSTCMVGGTFSTRITTSSSCPWTVSSNASWLVVNGAGSGTGSATIGFSAASNYDAPRDGLVMVRWPTPTAGQNVQVAQAGCRYAVSKSAIAFTATGGADTFNVIQQSDPTECGGPLQNGCVWTATSDVPWIVITSSMPRAGDDPVSFLVAENATATPRTGHIVVRDKVVLITQSGR